LKATKHLKCLDILFIINIHNLNFKIHHMHTLIYGIMYAIYFGNTKKNVVKTFKPIKWRCISYFNLLLFCFVDLLYFVPLLSNLLPILLHIIQKTCIHSICECLLIALLRWLAIIFPIFVLHKV